MKNGYSSVVENNSSALSFTEKLDDNMHPEELQVGSSEFSNAHFDGFEQEVDVYSGDEHDDDAIDLEGEAHCSLQMLKRVERTFIDYFLRKVGPSRKTEQVRESVFSTLTELLDSKYGKFDNIHRKLSSL